MIQWIQAPNGPQLISFWMPPAEEKPSCELLMIINSELVESGLGATGGDFHVHVIGPDARVTCLCKGANA
jgi:hypothetical protein